MIRLYIALYRSKAAYQWVLICVDDSQPLTTTKPVHQFQIIEEPPNVWHTKHGTIPLSTPTNPLLGCIRLPGIPTSGVLRLQDICEVISEYGEGPPQGSDHAHRWSPARWVMNVLRDLAQEHGLLDLVVDEAFHQRVLARGSQMEKIAPGGPNATTIVDL
ncbi:hypothetical protein BDN72DRAFT_275162 [Pluteus cervinus]|uniref:Uncharacterized protein n=1 Tax=Pluteus cervinus TaxID=181527 RepID=A0ACD3AEV8_9AGAR|nr:hypothetical protein BDN72DRAFT_275162 [Pluteus cervinus]